MNQSMVSNTGGFANNMSYQNIIDLSRGRKGTFKPGQSGEILLPSSLYKMYTDKLNETNLGNNDTILLGGGGNNSVFMPYYDMPNPDVIDEWVIVLDSLF